MAKETVKWTRQQQLAINAGCGDLLVSAGAGTGKTAVLSQRCVERLGDEQVCPDILGIVVLTFTEAAADQMRSRIASQLGRAYLKTGRRRFAEQLVLLEAADISTIHSFCRRLIVRHFYELGLDPAFGVIDEDQQYLLKTEVLEQTVRWAWDRPDLRGPLKELLYGRDLRTDGGFLNVIIEISDFLDTLVLRDAWYKKAKDLARSGHAEGNPLVRRWAEVIYDRLGDIAGGLEHAGRLCGAVSESQAKSIAAAVHSFTSLAGAGRLTELAVALRDFRMPAVRKPKSPDGYLSELIASEIKAAIGRIRELSLTSLLRGDYEHAIGPPAASQTEVVIELVEAFDRFYAAAKNRINCLDFADLERYALKLLSSEAGGRDGLVPSQTALELRRRYKFVFVDEYQDINPVQRAIIEAISGGADTFAVGDVKQSIYAWRGARPDIFAGLLKNAPRLPGGASDMVRIDLNTNFRSGPAILSFVNALFSRIMTEPLAGIAYDENAELKAAGGRAAADGAVEMHILGVPSKSGGTPPDGDGDYAVTNRRRQAALIAGRIRRLVGRSDNLRYRDIAILMRSLRNRVDDYIETLRSYGIPVTCESAGGYFEKTEVSDTLCLLKVLDNPRRDIELAAVLRSPFFAFTDSELAAIRLGGGEDEDFWDSVQRYRRDSSGELADKVERACVWLDGYRTLARRGLLSELIWSIYKQSAYLRRVTALPNGAARRANLLKLHDRAVQFERFEGTAGPLLARFVRFVEKLESAGPQWAGIEPPADAGDAVRILSVHKSKGLEFEVVFLAELDGSFGAGSTRNDCLVDEKFGLGLRIIDPRTDSRIGSLAHEVIAAEKASSELAEEMRILYVATTRAKRRLVLTGSQSRQRCLAAVEAGRRFDGGEIPPWYLRKCSNPMDWILCGLCRTAQICRAFGAAAPSGGAEPAGFSVRFYGPDELDLLTAEAAATRAGGRGKGGRGQTAGDIAAGEVLSTVTKALTWRYPHSDMVAVPAKQSVSQLAHEQDEWTAFEGRLPEATPEMPDVGRVMRSDSAGARLAGSAAHLVIANLDLSADVNADAVERTIRDLVRRGLLSRSLGRRLDAEAIAAFFITEPGRRALGDATVLREWPFTFALSPEWWLSGRAAGRPSAGPRGDRGIIVQGIIDMLIVSPRDVAVVDFKTDRIGPGDVPERAGLYRRQLELYGLGAAAVLKAAAVETWLYFLTPRRLFRVA